MKQRVISAAFVLAIFIPIYIWGGDIYRITVYLISLLGLKEFLEIKDDKRELPSFIQFISYAAMTFIVLNSTTLVKDTYSIDFRIVSGLLLALLMPVILYTHNKYNINDAFYLIGGIFFLGLSFNLLITLRNSGINILIYLFLITIFTDTYAYITGMLIGKHKLMEHISPKKTWEGMIGGTFFGVLIASVFYYMFINSNLPIWGTVMLTLFLSILGQFGDLVFSAIKRFYGKKDFSNIMPGHGGVLDRLDSIIFVVMGYACLVIFL